MAYGRRHSRSVSMTLKYLPRIRRLQISIRLELRWQTILTCVYGDGNEEPLEVVPGELINEELLELEKDHRRGKVGK